MDTLNAFIMGQKNKNKELMIFDWIEAAKLINQTQASHAEAGLKDDWEWSSDVIFKNNKPVKNARTYLASTWATPQLLIDNIHYDCYIMKSAMPDGAKWDENTLWPEEALNILNKV